MKSFTSIIFFLALASLGMSKDCNKRENEICAEGCPKEIGVKSCVSDKAGLSCVCNFPDRR
ncbi:hypothetical protein HYFRA_00010685 [Hymenoscyphus fraxineus]|uniref:Uncharacterized protein n=1 Tax=Hymenoscyphus fraxineus TaxID=746836 RepID=A0A9N9PW05_9HELO|nr:hypothetical protein HYFRA_00010685 [Hymenoscyphus fraxineus]